MTILYKILGGLGALLAFVAAIFTAGRYKQKAKQSDKNTEVLREAVEMAEQAEMNAREDLKRVKDETDKSDFSDINR